MEDHYIMVIIWAVAATFFGFKLERYNRATHKWRRISPVVIDVIFDRAKMTVRKAQFGLGLNGKCASGRPSILPSEQ